MMIYIIGKWIYFLCNINLMPDICRLKDASLKVLRPPSTIARYRMLQHTKRTPSVWNKRCVCFVCENFLTVKINIKLIPIIAFLPMICALTFQYQFSTKTRSGIINIICFIIIGIWNISDIFPCILNKIPSYVDSKYTLIYWYLTEIRLFSVSKI